MEFLNEIRYINNLMIEEKVYTYNLYDNLINIKSRNIDKNISPNIVSALKYAQKVNSKIAGVIGRDGGYTAKVADACIIIPTVNEENITPHSEAFQSVIWHLLVSHPKLKLNQTKWESI